MLMFRGVCSTYRSLVLWTVDGDAGPVLGILRDPGLGGPLKPGPPTSPLPFLRPPSPLPPGGAEEAVAAWMEKNSDKTMSWDRK